MADYEMTYILKSNFSEAQWEESRTFINSWIGSHEGAIQKEDIWGVRPLATEMDGEIRGFFVVLYFSLPGAQVKDFKFALNIHERMFRYLLTTRIPEPVPKAARS